MEKSIKGTRTEQNLLKAFAGESQARNRYEFFAKKAKEEGYEQISEIFMKTASQACYPAGMIGTTAENLKAAAMGENEEWTKLYPEFAEIAKEEGFSQVAAVFKIIAKVEAEHERRYLKLLKNLEEGKVFKKDEKTRWECRHCGYIHEGEKPPENCPACLHPKAYFEVAAENY
jgi:rubrerythrin